MKRSGASARVFGRYIIADWKPILILEPIPKIDKHIARKLPSIDVPYRRIKYLPTIRKIPDELWNEIKLLLPWEKPNNTIGRPIIPFRKVLDGILHVLRTGCQWKMLSREYGSGSTHVIGGFKNG